MSSRSPVFVVLVLLVSVVVMSAVFALVFDNVGLGIGPTIAVAAGIAGAARLMGRERR